MSVWMLVGVVVVWGVVAAASRWVMGAPVRGPEDLSARATYRVIRVYARLVHRLSVEGAEHLPDTHPDGTVGPLVVVANHTAGIDPLLVQAALDFEPRWMMATDMRDPRLEWMWELSNAIFVDRSRRDSASLREALRHLQDGGVLGVFPEGHIERPARHLLPFKDGVGFLIKRSGARVLPIIIDGTPQTSTAWGSIVQRSRSSLRILPAIDYSESGLSAPQIASDLRSRFEAATGWPEAPRRPVLTGDRWLFVDLDGRYVDASGEPVSDEEARRIIDEVQGAGGESVSSG